jgi:exopolysaccharide production protein ExoY
VTPTSGLATRARRATQVTEPPHERAGTTRGAVPARAEPPSIHLLVDDVEAVAQRPRDRADVAAVTQAVSIARLAVKRGVDVVGAMLGLLLLAPVLALVALAIKVDSRGPALFAHQRLGRNGRRFGCLKFRSMTVDAEQTLRTCPELCEQYRANHYKIPTDLDPRVTRLGRFLRKSSIDELPQLWNVLCGEMSLVGPRPIVDEEATHYGPHLDELLSVRPGLSGAWAVRGRSRVGYPDRVDIELEYVRQWTLLRDAHIIARTPWAVVTGRGVE